MRKMRPVSRPESLKVFRNNLPREDIFSRAMLVGIFALLRAGGLLNLRWGDLSFSNVDGISSTPLSSIKIRRSKTDKCGVGQLAYIACTAEAVRSFQIEDVTSDPCELCPVHAVLTTKPPRFSPEERVFSIRYDRFLDQVRKRLGPIIGHETVNDYGTHTLRRTGAQLLHRSWPADSPTFMRAGRWRSAAVLESLHDSAEDKAKLASCSMIKE